MDPEETYGLISNLNIDDVIAVYFLVAIVLVPISLVAKRTMNWRAVIDIDVAPGWLAQPRVGLGLWSCGAGVGGIYAIVSIWQRLAHRSWERFPVWSWGMDFDLSLKRETLGSAALAVAVVFFVVAVIKACQIATIVGIKQLRWRKEAGLARQGAVE